MSTNKQAADKHVCTVRLTDTVIERLDAICAHLGTNRNAYLINIIGRGLSQDEVNYKLVTHQDNSLALLRSFIESAAASVDTMTDTVKAVQQDHDKE